jgi:hypothetical protein
VFDCRQESTYGLNQSITAAKNTKEGSTGEKQILSFDLGPARPVPMRGAPDNSRRH